MTAHDPTKATPAERAWAIAKFQEWADEGRQPREHSVPCPVCRRQTWAISAVCSMCEVTQ